MRWFWLAAIVLGGCAGDGVQIEECDDDTSSTLECQLCCGEEGFSEDRVNYNSAVRYSCTCFPLDGEAPPAEETTPTGT